MTDYGTIKLPRDEYDRHNERRQDMGLTWAEYVDGEAPAGGVAPDAIADAVAARGVSLDAGERTAIANEVAQHVGPKISEAIWESLDADGLAQQTAAYVDRADVSLEASERRALAQEVAEVLQR